ncbi:MAG: hypothetical protein ACYTF7_05055 [Planctomycetota bacterium]|jgi:hypothetical protein
MANIPTNDAPPSTTLSDAEYDALADLFLGADPTTEPPLRLHRQDDAPPPAPTPIVPSPIEALILGHLPILAGPWVPQYARHLADTTGQTIGLIRLHAGQCSLDIYSSSTLNASLPANSHLSSAITGASSLVDRWLIRVDATDEPTLAECLSIDSITLLSSTDDAAVVSAYQTIKRLDTSHDPDDTPGVSIVFIGANERETQEASTKITRAVGAFLESPVSTSQGPEKLGPTNASNHYRGDAPESMDDLLAMLSTPASPEAIIAPPPPPPPLDAPPPVHVEPRTGVLPREAAPGQAPRSTRTAPRASSPTRLATHVPGLRDLGVSCPYAPDVSIAFDEDASLHLLCAHDGTTFQSLQVTRYWALDHAHLLATLADALGIRVTPELDTPITMHVFAHSVDSVRRLLDTPIRFHLLTDVMVHNTPTQVCVPLNS